MRQKRAKSYKKQINIYVHSFKFREPFQVLLDDEIILASEKSSYNLKKALERTIQGEVKPLISQCCMQALYKTNNQPAIDIAKEFERRRCNHPPTDPLTPLECIKSLVLPNNKFKYILAIQKFEFRKVIRDIPGVPLVFMKNSVMIMDSVSKATLRYADKLERAKLTGGLNDMKVGMKQEEPEQSAPVSESGVSKKRKGPKGPNPLSVKKKKPENPEHEKENEKGPKKTRRKRSHKKEDQQDNQDQQNNQGPDQSDAASE